MLPVPQSTSLVVVFKAYLASDHVSEATGKTIAITISKNGGAFGNPNAGATNATEISSGWYKVTLDTTDTGTTGPLAVRGAVATVDDVGVLYHVVKATNGGWTALPDTAVTTNGSLLTSGTGTAQLSVSSGAVTFGNTSIATVTNLTNLPSIPANWLTAAGIATGALDAVWSTAARTLTAGTNIQLPSNGLANITAWTVAITGNITGNLSGSVGSVTGLTASNLDATISSRLASGSYTVPLDAAGTRSAVGLASANLDTQLDALPTNAELATALGTADDAVMAQVALVKAVIDKLDDTLEDDAGTYRFTTNALEQAPSGGGSAPTASEIADEVETRTIAAVTLVNGLAANSVTAAALAADAVAEIQSGLPTANENADALLDRVDGVEVGLTPREAMRLSAAADGGKLSGAGTTTNTIRNAVADSKDRISATVDSEGNRTAITYDLT